MKPQYKITTNGITFRVMMREWLSWKPIIEAVCTTRVISLHPREFATEQDAKQWIENELQEKELSKWKPLT